MNNTWIAVMPEKELNKSNKKVITVLSKRILIVKENDTYHAFDDKCSHRGASFEHGRVESNLLVCPYHEFKFNMNGYIIDKPVEGHDCKCNKSYQLKTYPVLVSEHIIWIWFGENEPLPLPTFGNIDPNMNIAYFEETWEIDFTRCLEAQLDVFHLPYVHSSTIGRGGRVVAHGPLVEWLNESHMKIWVYNTTKDVKKVLKPNEFTEKEKNFSLEYLVPNVWQNNISDTFKVGAIFVPIEKGVCKTYLMSFHQIPKIPIIYQISNYFINYFNKKILHEDKAMVIGQQPTHTYLKMGERLVSADLPIVEFRKAIKKLGYYSEEKELKS